MSVHETTLRGQAYTGYEPAVTILKPGKQKGTPVKQYVTVTLLAGLVLAGLTGTASAAADPPALPVQAVCSKATGDVGTHVHVRRTALLRKYNNTRGQVIATLKPGKRLHLFHKYWDNRGASMWVARAYVNGRFLCGYIYPDRIDYHHTW